MTDAVITQQKTRTMTAAFIQGYGETETLVIGKQPVPKIKTNQVLIKVVSAGVNPVDFHIRNGMIADTGTHTLPLTLGWDASGTVVAIGQDVMNHKVGDQVFVFAPIDQQGVYAEYVAVDADLLAPKPKTLSMNESAAVPLAAVTAWQGLVDEGKLMKNQTVLILGASGGVGSFAVQIAKALGAHVIASASGKNEDYVKKLGADEFIDYKTTRFEDIVNDVDLAFVISSGGDLVHRALSVVRKHGRLVSTLDDIDLNVAKSAGVRFSRMWVQPNGNDLAIIGDMINNGDIRVHIDSIYPLTAINDAIKRSEAQVAVGKIVVEVSDA